MEFSFLLSVVNPVVFEHRAAFMYEAPPGGSVQRSLLPVVLINLEVPHGDFLRYIYSALRLFIRKCN